MGCVNRFEWRHMEVEKPTSQKLKSQKEMLPDKNDPTGKLV